MAYYNIPHKIFPIIYCHPIWIVVENFCDTGHTGEFLSPLKFINSGLYTQEKQVTECHIQS